MARKRTRKRKKPDVFRQFLLLNTTGDDRYWEVEIRGKELTTSWGTCDGTLRSSSKDFGRPEAARRELDKRVKEKVSKGYEELMPHNPDATQQALEDALAIDPDDLGAHSAYADYLQEKSDPKGEYLQLMLALEDENLDDKQSKKFERRTKKLLRDNKLHWLGDLMLLLRKEDHFEFEMRRGWVDRLVIRWLTQAQAEILSQSPHIRLLRELIIDDVDLEEGKGGVYDYHALPILESCPYLSNVRLFQLGEEGYSEFAYTEDDVLKFLQLMPRLEHLKLFWCEDPTLSVLYKAPFPSTLRQLTLGGDVIFDLTQLAKNKTLNSLTTLEIKPELEFGHFDESAPLELRDLRAVCRSRNLQNVTHFAFWRTDAGDKAIDELISSGMLERLVSLDLSYGNITDEGARKLIEAVDATKLVHLDLTCNAIEEEVVALQQKFPNVELADQHDPDDFSYLIGDLEYLLEYENDWE